MKKNKFGQSSFEYLIMVAVVVAVFVIAAGPLRNVVSNLYHRFTSGIDQYGLPGAVPK